MATTAQQQAAESHLCEWCRELCLPLLAIDNFGSRDVPNSDLGLIENECPKKMFADLPLAVWLLRPQRLLLVQNIFPKRLPLPLARPHIAPLKYRY